MRRELTIVALGTALCLACGASTPDGAVAAGGTSASSGGAQQANRGGTSGSSAGLANASGGATVASSGGAPTHTGDAGDGGANPATGGTGNEELPPSGVPSSYRLVYAQTFTEPSSLSDLDLANPTEWRHNEGGFLESTGASYRPPYRSPFSVAIISSIELQSFVMDIELQQTSPDGDAHRDMVLVWSFISPSEFYYAHISTRHDGVAHNVLIVNSADRKSISSTFTEGYDWGRGIWKRLRVVHDAMSGAMSIYDLDTPSEAILTANDTTFSGGYLGFGSFDNTGRVRNVKVWAAASTPGNADFFGPVD